MLLRVKYLKDNIAKLANWTDLPPGKYLAEDLILILFFLLQSARICAKKQHASDKIDNIAHTPKATMQRIKSEFDREVINAGVIVTRIICYKVAHLLLTNSKLYEDLLDVGRNINSSMSFFLRRQGKEEGAVLVLSVHKMYNKSFI